jgi:predicted transcriptional regulator
MTQKEIAKKMKIAVGTVNRYCKELDEEDKNSIF